MLKLVPFETVLLKMLLLLFHANQTHFHVKNFAQGLHCNFGTDSEMAITEIAINLVTALLI